LKISQTTFILLLLSSILVFSYFQTLSYPFSFDDQTHIVENTGIRINSFTTSELYHAITRGYPTRPVATLSLALNYLVGQLNPSGYRLVNLIIHLINGILVFFLLKKTCGLAPDHCSKDSIAPFFGTLLWFAHPLQVQSVTYIIQRMTSLSTLFYLGSLLLFIQAKTTSQKTSKNILYTSCIFCGLLAIGSKEIAITLPIIILLYNFFFLKNVQLSSKKIAGISLLFLSVIIFSFFVISQTSPIHLIQQSYTSRNFTLIERLLTEPRVILFYLSLLFFPYYKRLNLDHDFSLSSGLFHPPQTVAAIVILIFLFLIAIVTKRKKTILSFAIFWFLLNLTLESSFLGLEIIFEHRLYLPSIFLFYALIVTVERYTNKQLLLTVLSFFVLTLTFWTYQRNLVWETPISLWQDVCQKSPLKSRPHDFLGHAYYNTGDYAQALLHLKKAAELDPKNLSARNTMGVILSELGHPDTAIKIYETILKINHHYAKTQLNLADLLYREGQTQKALKLYSTIINQHPAYPQAYVALGKILIQNAPEKATLLLEQASKLDQNNPKLHKMIGDLYFSNNMLNKAKQHYMETLSLSDIQPTVHNALGGIYFGKGDLVTAQYHFLTAVKQDPFFEEAKKNLGITSLRMQRKNDKK
jgi:tetratricopeptide (TPR) repeat protein